MDAEVLGLGEAKTFDACGRGLLEANERDGFLYVRPAIVSVLEVASSDGTTMAGHDPAIETSR